MHRNSSLAGIHGILLGLGLLAAAVGDLPRAHGQPPTLQDDLHRLKGAWTYEKPRRSYQATLTFTRNELEVLQLQGIPPGGLDVNRYKLLIELRPHGDKRQITPTKQHERFTACSYRFDGKKLVIEDGEFQGEWQRAAAAQLAPTLELRLTTNKLVHKLDLGGKTPEEFLRPFRELKRKPQDIIPFTAIDKLPPCPRVDLVLEIRNTSDRAVDFWSGSLPALTIEGPGIHHFCCETGRHVIPLPFVEPSKITLAPGKSTSLRLEQLMTPDSPMTLDLERYYWTHPGAYTVQATWKLSTGSDQTGSVTLISNPVTLRVASAQTSPARLRGMQQALADIAKGELKLKSVPPPAPPWQEEYHKLLKQQCGIDLLYVDTRLLSAPDQWAEFVGYQEVMLLEIEHRYGQGILELLGKQAADNYKAKTGGR